MVRTNTTLAKIDEGHPTFGAWVATMSPRAGEAFGVRGLDWAVIDMEHTPIGGEAIEDVVRAIEHYGSTPFVRVPEIDYGLKGTFKRVLDSGAMGVIVPRVESAEDAETVVRAALYPPTGDRGVVGGSRANDYGTNFDSYVEQANNELLVCVQLETATGAARAEEILSVDGINGVFIGENDLSATHDAPGEKGRDYVQADVDEILAAAAQHDVYTGIVAADPDTISQRLDDGIDMISIGSDLSLIARSIGALIPE